MQDWHSMMNGMYMIPIIVVGHFSSQKAVVVFVGDRGFKILKKLEKPLHGVCGCVCVVISVSVIQFSEKQINNICKLFTHALGFLQARTNAFEIVPGTTRSSSPERYDTYHPYLLVKRAKGTKWRSHNFEQGHSRSSASSASAVYLAHFLFLLFSDKASLSCW